jgi:4-hydroxy-2-oxoheptanedioate aldolase
MALKNSAKERLSRGEVIGGFGITMAAPGLAQIMARSGADFLTIDLEHGVIDLPGVHAIIAATAGTDCVPVVRVHAAQSWAVKPVLDAGALGIVFPMVRDRAELEAGIAATLYPPLGTRGIAHHYAPARWGVTGADYLREANDALLKIALIETAEAVENIGELLATPGLDVATIAPGDLAASLGHPGQTQHPEVLAAIATIEKAVGASGVALGGVATSVADARKKVGQGYRVMVLGFDVGLMAAASSELVGALRT